MKKEECWYTKPVLDIFKELSTSEKGLSSSEASARLEKFGMNELPEKRQTPLILKFLKQFNSPLIYILLVAMIISFYFKHFVDAYVILAVLIFNAVIGFVQERKAERAIGTLKKMIRSYAKVYRNNQLTKIPSSQLVPGDIVSLEEGDKVPADCRLIEVRNFRTQESSLTGESFPEDKNIKIISEEVSLGDRANMVFMSTHIVSGTAKAVVVETASFTEIGKVAESIQEVELPKSHFKQKVTHLTFIMALFAIIGAGLTFLIGFYYRKFEFMEISFFTIASLVSGIPEGLPAVLSIVLAVGAWRMAKQKAIMRHLPSVETLGVTTVIATDKTGTLTQNSLVVEKIVTSEGLFNVDGNGWQPIGKFYQNKKPINPKLLNTLNKLFSISTLSNKGNLLRKDSDYEIVGDPTEVALLVLSKKAGIERSDLFSKSSQKIIDDMSFNSELKFRATLIEIGDPAIIGQQGKKQIYSIGAFEKIISNSSFYLSENKSKLNDKTKKDFIKKAEALARQGYRVLALAYKDMSYSVNSVSSKDVNNMILVGIVAMKDPPRKEVKDAIQKAKKAGIRIIMNTGDHKETAIAIAKEIGLVNENNSSALSQNELEKMSDSEFSEAIKNVNIFARVSPKMKLKIVQTLQNQGHIVAMTGDGVNDAPALKRADIGIAMGIIGTDVARESSEFILADDNFASIVNAVEEGRVVFRNMRNASTYLVSTNVAEDITIISSLLLSFPLPLLPIHLLWMNLVTDGFNGVALSLEQSHHTALSGPPHPKKEQILNNEAIPFLIIVGLIMAVSTISFFTYFYSNFGINKAMTAAFVSMTMCQLFNVFNMRSLKKSIFKIGFFSNKYILYALTTSVIFMLSVIYISFLQTIFKFEALSILELLTLFAISSLVFVAGEIYKWFRFLGKD